MEALFRAAFAVSPGATFLSIEAPAVLYTVRRTTCFVSCLPRASSRTRELGVDATLLASSFAALLGFPTFVLAVTLAS